MLWGTGAASNTKFPQLEDDECGWDAAGTPERYVTSMPRKKS